MGSTSIAAKSSKVFPLRDVSVFIIAEPLMIMAGSVSGIMAWVSRMTST